MRPGEYTYRAMWSEWFVQPNDLVGGWCLMTMDQPPSMIRPDSDDLLLIADVFDREVATYMAALHNAELMGREYRRGDHH